MNLAAGHRSNDRLEKAMDQLSDTLENAERLLMHTGFLVKFGKTESGEKISVGLCEKLVGELVAMVQGLLSDVKGFRRHLPKK